MESGNGIPAILAGPCSGTSTTNNGFAAAIGCSIRSAASTASHIWTNASAARRSHRSHGWPFVGELDDLVQLLGAELPLPGRICDRRQRLQRSCGLDLLPHRARGFPIPTGRDIHPASLVEHRQDRVLLRLQPTDLAHDLAPARFQPLGGVGTQLVEEIGMGGHPHDQTMGV
jgi:hypothetical protein